MKRTSFVVKATLTLAAWTAACLLTMFATAVVFARPLAAPPTISSINPTSATAGAGFTLVVNGNGFDGVSRIFVDNKQLTLNGVTATTITGTAAACSFTTAGSFNVTVSNVDGTTVAAQQLTISPAPATVITITPAAASNVPAGGTANFSAVATDACGNAVSASAITWSSNEPSKGTVSAGPGAATTFTSTGLTGTFVGLVKASLDGAERTANVTVVPDQAMTLVITPTSDTLTVAQTRAFTAAVYDRFNNPRPGDAPTWQASAGTFSSGSNPSTNPTYTAPNTPGTIYITATFGALTPKYATITVNAGAPASVVILTPASNLNLTVPFGGQAFTAEVRDSLGNNTGLLPTWSATGGTFTGSGNSVTYNPPTTPNNYTVSASYGALPPATRQVTVNAGPPAQLSIVPSNATLAVGGNLALTAYVSDTANNPLSGGTVVWTKVSGVGTVTSSGARTAIYAGSAIGSAVLRASLGDATNTASVTVNAGTATSLSIQRSAPATPAGGSIFLTATVLNQNNAVFSGGNVVWDVTSGAGTVTTTGSRTATFSGTPAGANTVRARLNGGTPQNTTALTINPGQPFTITLTPPSASVVVAGQQLFTANVRDQYGNAIANSTLSWSTSGPQVGTLTTIDASTVRLNAGTVAGAYPAGVRVSSDGLNQSASVTLTPGPLSKVTLNPTSDTFKPNETKQFTAQGRDQYDNPISGLTYVWSLSAGAPGTLTPSGQTAQYQAGTSAGTFVDIVRASSGGLTGRATVVVNPDNIASITVSPASATSQPDATQTFTARAFDPFGNEITTFGVNWSTFGTGFVESSGPKTATIRAGTIAGSYPAAVRASAGGAIGTADLTVVAGPLASINVQPAIVVMGASNTQNFSAQGLDAWGNTVPGFAAAWSTTAAAGSFDSSSATGAVFRSGTTPGTYPDAVQARMGSVVGDAIVIVLQGTVANVVITPASATVGIHQTHLFEASVTDPFGNPFPQLSVLWQLSPANIGTILSSGQLTALVQMNTQAGTFVNGLQAFNGSVAGHATITVPPDAATNLQMSADPTTLATDGVSVSTIVVTVTDGYGNPVGAGQTVSLAVDACSGTCSLGTSTANTDPQGRIITTLRSDHRSPAGATSTIGVTARLDGGLAKSISLNGQFNPFRAILPALLRDAPINNHGACSALSLNTPDSVKQAADNVFNIYRFEATADAHTISVSNYGATGKLLLYRITNDGCAASNSMNLVYIAEAGITSSTLYQKTFTGLVPGQNYLLAVNTTAQFTGQVYTLSIGP